jgi:FkbM family methyltransferase
MRQITRLLHTRDAAFCLALLRLGELAGETDEILCGIAGISPCELQNGVDRLSAAKYAEQSLLCSARSNLKGLAADSQTAALFDRIINRHFALLCDRPPRLRFNLGTSTYSLSIPNPEGAWAIYETLVLATYQHLPVEGIDHIYDLGAYIGLSALYLHSLYPKARVTCVEPSHANLLFLQSNLAENLYEYSVVPHAVAGVSKELVARIDQTPSMLNSAVIGASMGFSAKIKAVALDKIVSRTSSYGLKLDIEGGEYDLKPCEDIIRSARWVLGELHYGDFSRSRDKWLVNLLDKQFRLTLFPPKIDKYRGYRVVAQPFRALPRQ